MEANDLLDQFEKLIQIYDSYGAFRRLAAQKLGVPTIRVTIKEINEITDLFIKKANDLEEIKNNGENIEAKNLCLKYWKKYYELRAGYLDASMYDGKIFHSPLLDKCKEDTRVTMAIFMAFQKPFN